MVKPFSEQEEVIELLQNQAFEVFMDIMDKLISDNKWSNNEDFIYLITRKGIIECVAVGIFNKRAEACWLRLLSREDFINVINIVTKRFVRKYPAAKSLIKEKSDKLVFKLVRII